MTCGIAQELDNSPELTGNTVDKTSFTRRFIVASNDPADGPRTVMNAVGVPQPFTWYSYGNDGTVFFCNLVDRKIKKRGSGPLGVVWEVEANYETPSAAEQQGQHQQPELELPECKMSPENKSVPMQGYWSSNEFHAWRNSAYEILQKVPERDETHIVLEIARNEPLSSNVMGNAATFMNSCNSDSFWGLGAGVWKCNLISADIKRVKLPDETYYDYLRVGYKFALNNNPEVGNWDVKLLDAGSYYLDGTDKITFKNADGHKRIGFLDGSGGDNGNAEPVYLPVKQRYPRIAFASLNLPNSFEECKASQ